MFRDQAIDLRASRPICGGFTLLEILLALAIAALLIVIGYRGLSQLLDSETQLRAQSERWRALDQFFARFETDLRKAVPRTVRGPGGNEPAFWLANENNDNRYAGTLRFSRAGGENSVAGFSAGQRIEYRLRGENVELVYAPYLDNPGTEGNTTYALLDKVASWHVQSYDARGMWNDTWPASSNLESLPRAVRVELRLTSGESLERWFTLQP